MNGNILEWIAGVGGVGAVFGLLMYILVREQLKAMREDHKFMEDSIDKNHKFMEDRMNSVITDYNRICKENQETTIKNTVVLTELITFLRMKNGNKS